MAVALMVRAPLPEAIRFAMAMQPMLETMETLHARVDLGTGMQRFNCIHAKMSPLARAGLEAKEKCTRCKMGEVEYRFDPAPRRPAGVSLTGGPPAARAPAPASVPFWKGPRPDLSRLGEDKIGEGHTGRTWVRGTSYAEAAGAGVVNSAQAAQILARPEALRL